jgi:glyoxylate carboligase
LQALAKSAKSPAAQAAAIKEIYARQRESSSVIENPYTQAAAKGGLMGLSQYAAGGKLLRGAGDGMSDSIPAVINGPKPQRAALADGEFVIPADVVSHLGNGSTSAGSKRLYAMMDQIRMARTGNKKQGKQIDPRKFMPR